MKKIFAILALAAGLAACGREELPEVVGQPETPTTYTLSINASKGSDTRDLKLDGNTLNAVWKGDEKVYVFSGGQQLTYLMPDKNTHPGYSTCTLVGSFPNLPTVGAELTLKLNSNNYSGQDGTLAFIAGHNDYAVATLHVTGVVGDQITTRETAATFESQQAIIKFTLKDKNGAVISPSALTVTDGTRTVSLTGIPEDTYTTNGDGVLYVAFPAAGTAKTISLVATVGSETYTYKKSGVTFSNEEYYAIAVKMARNSNIYDLSDETLYDTDGVFTAPTESVLVGTFPGGDRQVRIADGATVSLRGVTISQDLVKYAGVGLDGSATIILEGENNISGNSHHAGISLGGPSSTLTILGSGSLTATGGYGAAGIGCNETDSDCGAINICGGIITATSTSHAAGIGCGFGNASCGAITISGGTITATGGYGAAGIGCGEGNGSCGAITISDPARVTATRAWVAPYCIGPSTNGHCESVTIYGELYWDGSSSSHDAILRANSLEIPIS